VSAAGPHGPLDLSPADIVGHRLEEAGIAAGPEELELLVAAYDTVRKRAASLYLPEAELFEPADVFVALDRPEGPQ
jgi:hypothetical protein